MQASPTSVSSDGWRQRLATWLNTPLFGHTITALILLNAIILGVETSAVAQERAGQWLNLLNQIVLAVFVLEIVLKLVAFGPRFFRSGWNVFDFLIVAISLAPASGPLAILRSLRILRVLRLLSSVKRLRMLVESLMQALPGIGWTAALLYTTGCALRLARFNTMLDDPNRPKWHSAFFVGVPAPAGAALAMLPMYVSFTGLNVNLPQITAGFASIYLVLVGLLMASRIPTWSGKGAGIRVPRSYAIPIIMLLVLYVAMLVSYFWETLTLTIVAYYVSIPFSWQAFSRRSRREQHQYGPPSE